MSEDKYRRYCKVLPTLVSLFLILGFISIEISPKYQTIRELLLELSIGFVVLFAIFYAKFNFELE